MPAPLIAAIAAPLAGGLAGKVFGPKQAKTTAAVPQDLQGLRGNMTGLLQYLLGFGGPPAGLQGPGQPTSLGPRAQGPGVTRFGGPMVNFGEGGPNVGPNGPAGLGGQGPTPGGQNPITDRIQGFFGQLGQPFNNLQNTAAGSANRMLTQQSPEQRALESAFPFLQQTGVNPQAQNRLQQGATQSGINPGVQNFYGGLLGNRPDLGPGGDVESILGTLGQTGGINATTGPGSNIMNQINALARGGGASGNEGFLQGMLGQNPALGVDQLLQPVLQKNLALADQAGGRFGSANALMRSDALGQYNADLANRLQQGVGQQLSAAGLLGQQAQAQRAAQLQALGLGGNLMSDAARNQLTAAGQLGGFRQQGAISGLQGQLQGAGAMGQMGLQDIGQQLGAAGQLGQLGLAGQQNLLQGAGVMGNLAQGAGGAERQNLLNAWNIGSGQAQQADVENQRRLSILLSLLNPAFGAAFNVPTQTTPSGGEQGAALGGQIGNIIASFYGNRRNP